MSRYKANTNFGSWTRGEVFESTDPWYEKLAESGRLVELIDNQAPAQEKAHDYSDESSIESSSDDEDSVPDVNDFYSEED